MGYYLPQEGSDRSSTDRPMGSVKHPFVAWLLASARMVAFSLRHFAKPMRVDYRTGDVWLDGG